MIEIHVEFRCAIESDTVFDSDDVMTMVGGRALAEYVSAGFRRLGCETTEPGPQSINGWFWDTTYRGRTIKCQAVDLEPALIIFRFFEHRQIETLYALLTLLDRELKQDPTLSDFHWFRAWNGRYAEIGSAPVQPGRHPDPLAVVAAPDSFDLPPSGTERFLAWLFKRRK